ncbi:hypothetical protein FOA43_002678 [Brettanomyces nanus]|uniref:Origin recognition complex subunit 4 n=1 Tax=Eeniella nana TaxID=13502 RepID=A0A875S4N0_EENNA|nr:uncharacterized protein FOA43_002678 [Brettanomyces nanus]QPG75325.1 hypothetical protein FOA43_002678 [Brettanomyces nanus]
MTFQEVYGTKLRGRVLGKLSAKTTLGDKLIRLYDLDKEQHQMYKVLENTVKYREGKSVLLIGPRGIGKTTMVNNCLLELGSKYEGQFLVIRISGLYERDDKTAIREIARQLDFIMEEEDDGDEENEDVQDGFEKVSSNATMRMIMSLLDRTQLNEEEDVAGGKREADQIPLIFVIDEVDKYASNSKQTLLYNLFDIAQASEGRKSDNGGGGGGGSTLTVIGISSKATVREQLEKRVKSRFSQRMIQLNKCKTLTDYCGAIGCMLKLEDDDNDDEWVSKYNKKVDEMINTTGSALRKIIVENFYTVKDLNALKNSLVPYMKYGFVRGSEQLLKSNLEVYDDRNFELLGSLTELELKLLICTARVKSRNSIDRVNFNVAFEEYLKMAANETNTLNTQLETMGVSLRRNGEFTGNGYSSSRELMLGCWERLAEIGVMGEPMKQINGVNAESYTGGEFNKMYVCDIELNEIMKYFREEREEAWVEKWCRI